jgi:WD40 repeat protein
MAEATHQVGFPASGGDGPSEYDAFLSYAHRDRQVTTAIQKGLHQIGRRLGRLRALRVFRDDTNLTASPDLWGKITEALDQARYMIVVLSPQAAASHWVNEEIRYWLAHRGDEHLMLVLAEGRLRWDATSERFDPEHSDAAPAALTEPGSLRSEPLYIDVSDDEPWDLGSLTFRDKVTALAAPIHGKPKDQLAGDDLREQRQFRRLRAAAISGLVVLTVVAVVAALIAVAKQHEANARLRDAVVAKLNAEGPSMLAGTMPGGDVRAMQELLAANAIQANGVPILNAQIARFTTQKIIDRSSAAYSLAYSPDGSRIASAQGDSAVRQWDSTTGKPIGAPMKGHTGRLRAIAYTPDGRTIASAGLDGTMWLFNADTGAALNPKPRQVDPLTAISVSPDGKVVFTGNEYGTLQRWDAHSGQLLSAQPIFNSSTPISDLAVDGGGNLLAASNQNGDIAVYDAKSLNPHGPTLEVRTADGAAGIINKIAFTPDGHTIAVASQDLQLWNVDTGTFVHRLNPGTAIGQYAEALAISPDGHQLVTGREDGAVQLWDAATGAQFGQTMVGHTETVKNVAFSPNGRQIASTSVDGTLRLWSATVGQPMRGPDPMLWLVAFSPDGQRVGASGDAAVQQWDVSSGERLAPLVPSGVGAKRFGYVDGNRMLTSSDDGTVQLVDAKSGQALQPPIHLDTGGARHVTFAFSGDGHKIASGREDDAIVQLWDAATGRALGHPMTVDSGDKYLYAMAFSPDGHHLASAYLDGLQLWNTDTTQPEGPVFENAGQRQGTNEVTVASFSQDGQALAGGSADGVQLWNPSTRKPFEHSPLRGQKGVVTSVAFGVGHQLASGGLDAALRLWDTATGKPTAAPQPQSETILSVALSPDGRLAASANADGTLRLSPALADPAQLCAKLPANMSHKQWRDWISPSVEYITLCPGLPLAPD